MIVTNNITLPNDILYIIGLFTGENDEISQ